MITGIEHIAFAVKDVAQGVVEMAALVGRPPVIDQSSVRAMSARLQLDNLAVRLHAAEKPEAGVAAIRLVLTAADIDNTQRRLARRSLPGALRHDIPIYDIEPTATHGVPISVMAAATPAQPDSEADIAGLDHVVIRTPDPERAVALYGGRLGLDLRLDRSNPVYGSRMLFFVCGGLVVEVTHDLKAGVGAGPDRIWGLAWRANDIARAHARMNANGVAVSELRSGRRQGTQVFTVKSHTLGVPTLVIGGEGLQRS